MFKVLVLLCCVGMLDACCKTSNVKSKNHPYWDYLRFAAGCGCSLLLLGEAKSCDPYFLVL